MSKFMKAPIEDDLLDNQQFDDSTNNLNKERQKLSYWVRFACALALLIAGSGVLLFSYFFLEEWFFFRYNPYKIFWILGAGVWFLIFVGSLFYARAGSVYGKITLGALLVIAVGAIGIHINNDDFSRGRLISTRVDELIIIGGLYITGLLVFPAAFYGWKYAQALRVPQVGGEEWEWKAKIAQLGLKAWRFGALAFIVLGMAWTPVIITELQHYNNRRNYVPLSQPWEVEPAIEQVQAIEEQLMEELEESLPSDPLEEDNAPEDQ